MSGYPTPQGTLHGAGRALSLCGVLCLASMAGAQEVPLELRGPAAAPCPLDHRALRDQSGLNTRSAAGAEASWRATLTADQGTGSGGSPVWTLELRRPDLTLAAHKQLSPGSCRAAAELLAILLAAHASQVSLPAPATRPVKEQPPPRRAPAGRWWQVSLGGGVAGFGEHLSALVLLAGELALWPRLGIGLQIALAPWSQDLTPSARCCSRHNRSSTPGAVLPR